MKVFASFSIAALTWASAAVAQDCSVHVGQVISPKSFEQAIAGLGNIAPKGEFETTSQYQTRISNSGSATPMIISKKPEDHKHFVYDADNQLLQVKSYAFHNTNMGWWRAFYETKPTGIKASVGNNRAIVISMSDRPTGTYVAQNSYGASTTVTRIERTTYSIFERESPIGEDGIFFGADGDLLGIIPMDIATAQRIKPALKIAFVVVPKPPFLVQGSHSVGKTTISNPIDVTEKFKIMIADMQCGLLTDGTNKVLAAYAMK